MYIVYWMINENKNKTYVGFSDNIKRRIKEHQSGKVKSTKKFGKFKIYKLEEVENVIKARKREKYWKSSTGRKRLTILFKTI
jgi:putative endonuclease